MIIANIADFREAARRRLPRFLFEYMDGGSYAEVTLRRNVEDLADIALRQRVLRDVSAASLSTELFGQKLNLPVALAPIAGVGLVFVVVVIAIGLMVDGAVIGALLAVLGVLAVSVSKPYYFAPALTLLFPAAGVVIERDESHMVAQVEMGELVALLGAEFGRAGEEAKPQIVGADLGRPARLAAPGPGAAGHPADRLRDHAQTSRCRPHRDR